jgi:hypothetical protein
MELITGDALKEYLQRNNGVIQRGHYYYFRCTASFYTNNENGTLNRKIPMCSKWIDLGIEKHARKLKRLDRKMDNPYIFIDKEIVKQYFKLEGIVIPERV